jgi:hypothetical protein
VNINKSSWHFKLLDMLDFKLVWKLCNGDTVTLCQYFWNVVGAVLLGISTGSIITFLALGSLFIAATMLSGLVIFFGASWLPAIEAGSYLYSNHRVGLLLVALVGTAFVWQTTIDQVRAGLIVPQWLKLYKREVVKPQKDAKPNILFEYIKAKKAKFCPVVKLED